MTKRKQKAFRNFKHNGIHLTFPNGNVLSTVWGYCTYSDNYDMEVDVDNFNKFLDSDTVEIAILEAPDRLRKKIEKKYDFFGDVRGRLTMEEWLDVVKMLSKQLSKDQPMTDTIKLSAGVERRLKEWSENPDTGLCADFTTDGYAYYEELKIFLAQELAQARAEERERIEQEITRVCKYAEDYRNYDMRGVDWQSILHPTDLLSSLDKPVTKEE